MKKPKFVPKPGQIDYTNVKRAPVINCIVQYKDKILLLKRSSELNFYPKNMDCPSSFSESEH